MFMHYICVYQERKGPFQFARMETIKEYMNWADSAHSYGVVWSHLIEKDTGKLIMSFREDENGETQYHLY